MTPRYHINLFWSEEDGSWIATIPDLRGCTAFGDTPGDALREIQVAMEGWLETAGECGISIPEPTYRCEPAVAQKQR